MIVIFIDSIGVEHSPKEIEKFISNENIKNIYGMRPYDSTMCGYFCNGFINFMFEGKSLTGFKNSFSLNNFKK